MKIEPNHNYVTKAGYVVQFGDSLWSKNRVPYITSYGGSYLDGSIASWRNDGTICGLTSEWAEKLHIVAELPIEIPTLPEGYRWKDGFIQWRLPQQGETFIHLDNGVIKAHQNYVSNKNFIIESAAGGKEIVMNPVVKKSASLIGGLIKKTANYWLVEPALNIARPIIKSVRYATFLTVVAGSVYAFYHPDKVKDLAWKCLPKVTIEAPEILKPKA